MLKNGYSYIFRMQKKDGRVIGSLEAGVDWGPALEWAELEALRRERIPAGADLPDLGREVQPLWKLGKEGSPSVRGFRISLSLGETDVSSSDFPVAYFRKAAEEASVSLVASGDLAEGEKFEFTVAAFPADEAARRRDGGTPFTVRRKRSPLTIRERPLADLVKEARSLGRRDEADLRVFLPGRVMRETMLASREAGSSEIGGILIGSILRDPESRDLYLEITGQIQARHTRSSPTRLTFTPETWTAVQSAIDLRRRGETWLGWWHSHPFLKDVCDTCEKKGKGCRSHAAFLSGQDLHLHRTVFHGAHHLALVLSDSPCSGLIWALYGWRRGAVTLRGFDLVRPEDLPELRTDAETESSMEGVSNYAVH